MDSFAIWYDERKIKKGKKNNKLFNKNSKTNSENAEITLNFNLWRLDEVYQNVSFKIFKKFLYKKRCIDVNRCNYVLDIGMNIKDIEKIKNVYLYVPFKIEKSNMKDLGQIMIRNKKVIDGIFNENSKITKKGYEDAIEVSISNSNLNIKIFKLDFIWQKNIFLEEREKDTIIKIDVSKFKVEKGARSYLRFRIQGHELNKLIQTKKIKDNPLKTYSESNDIIDFRLNEKRSMPEGLVNLMTMNKEFRIEAIHFLLLMDMKYTLAATGLKYTTRALETNLWDKYLECEIKDAQMVGYHWKEKVCKKSSGEMEYVENFNSLIRIEEKKCDFRTLTIYFFVLLLVNVLMSAMFEFCFKDFLKYIFKV